MSQAADRRRAWAATRAARATRAPVIDPDSPAAYDQLTACAETPVNIETHAVCELLVPSHGNAATYSCTLTLEQYRDRRVVH